MASEQKVLQTNYVLDQRTFKTKKGENNVAT